MRTNGKAGWTLTELLVSLVIFGVLMAVLLLSLSANRAAYQSAEAYIRVQEEARRALEPMVKELHGAGHVNNDVSIALPGVQRLDFQIVRSYDQTACGGICWGTENASYQTGWVHYVVDAASQQLLRCTTANRLDPMPANYAGCRVLANAVATNLASTGFTYDHAARTVTIQLLTAITDQQLPGGQMQVAPTPLVIRVPLRNTL